MIVEYKPRIYLAGTLVTGDYLSVLVIYILPSIIREKAGKLPCLFADYAVFSQKSTIHGFIHWLYSFYLLD